MSDSFSHRVEAAVPEALDFLRESWTNPEPIARALVERVLAAADQAEGRRPVSVLRIGPWEPAAEGSEEQDADTRAPLIGRLDDAALVSMDARARAHGWPTAELGDELRRRGLGGGE